VGEHGLPPHIDVKRGTLASDGRRIQRSIANLPSRLGIVTKLGECLAKVREGAQSQQRLEGALRHKRCVPSPCQYLDGGPVLRIGDLLAAESEFPETPSLPKGQPTVEATDFTEAPSLLSPVVEKSHPYSSLTSLGERERPRNSFRNNQTNNRPRVAK
jgi:hypothetical protein